jgi:hypothetical protein
MHLRAEDEGCICIGAVTLQAGVLSKARCSEALTDLRHQRPAGTAAATTAAAAELYD